MFSTNQVFGSSGELWAYKKLKERGYSATMQHDFFSQCCDLKIGNRLPVEVKISRRHSLIRRSKDGILRHYPRWIWNVSAVNAQDRVLILIAEDKANLKWPYIMPGALMAHRTAFEINTHPRQHRGMMAPFLNNWAVLDYLIERVYEDGDISILEWQGATV